MRRLGGFGLVPLVLALMAATACGNGETASAEGDGEGSAIGSARINPLIALHEAGQPQFGLYAPSPGGGRGRGDQPPPPEKSPEERASETLGYTLSDYVFDGSMERGVDAALPTFAFFKDAMQAQGANAHTHPMIVKTAKIEGAEQVARDVAKQLDAGVSGIMFVEVETAEEARMGLAAMRYVANGGTRPDGSVGSAPAYWGVSAEEYQDKADLWPLDPDGELISWVIVESLEGLKNVREIAAVPGIGVLWPGAGTLRGIFSTTDAEGRRVLDQEGWEAAIQSVLSACKEFNVPCGFPANAEDIGMRMEQGFDVFVMGWGEPGFATVEMGREMAGR
jgi:4-hydroxy-2-oxoheptanedioate aldolase